MADEFVDPYRGLVAEGRRHRVLAVGATGDRHVGAFLGEVGGGEERVGDKAQIDAVRLAQHQEVAGLSNILRRRAPMHPAAMFVADDPREFPHQRHDRVAGAGKPLVDAGAVEELVMRGGGDRRCDDLLVDPLFWGRFGWAAISTTTGSRIWPKSIAPCGRSWGSAAGVTTRRLTGDVRDNICLLSPDTIERVNHLIVAEGHRLVPEAVRRAGQSFVPATNIHYPTDSSLIGDGLRTIVPLAVRLARLLGLGGWRHANTCFGP